MIQKIMCENNIIEKVTQPTDLFAPMVTVMKPNGKVHIGLQKPNENVKRERFKMPTTEETLAKRTGAIVFS